MDPVRWHVQGMHFLPKTSGLAYLLLEDGPTATFPDGQHEWSLLGQGCKLQSP